MRTALALMILVFSASVAAAGDEEVLCSGAFDKPAKLAIKDAEFTLTIGDRVETYEAHEPYDGVKGFSIRPTNEAAMPKDPLAELPRYDAYTVKLGDEEAFLFKDRVFWPCKKHD